MKLPAELRYAIRALLRSPAFFTVAALSLALGIGANTAVFTMVDQVLVRMLPVEEPSRLVQLKGVGDHYGSNTGMNALSYPLYKDFSEQNPVFSGMFCRARAPFSVSYSGAANTPLASLSPALTSKCSGFDPPLGACLLRRTIACRGRRRSR